MTYNKDRNKRKNKYQKEDYQMDTKPRKMKVMKEETRVIHNAHVTIKIVQMKTEKETYYSIECNGVLCDKYKWTLNPSQKGINQAFIDLQEKEPVQPVHKQLPQRFYYNNEYTWCLKGTDDDEIITGSWEDTTCKDCLALKEDAQNVYNPMNDWIRRESWNKDNRPKISTPSDSALLLREYSEKEQEHFIVLTLNGANQVINQRVVTVGLVNQTQVHPREIFKGAIEDNATSIIVSHNHPSGQLEPSSEDLAITRHLIKAGETIGIDVLDHVIIASKGYYSLLEHGYM